MIAQYIAKVRRKESLTAREMTDVIEAIMTAQATEQNMEDILLAFNEKPLNVEELTAAAQTMRKYALPVKTKHTVVLDTCGTGGDTKGTFNISTAVAIIVAAAGVAVAKHGNRSVSSRCGSADILEHWGVKIDLDPAQLGQCLDEVGIAFLFAQKLHPAMKNVAAVRKRLGVKTIFNLLGPLTNPANATHQIVGVYSREWVDPLAQVLKNLGVRKAMVVHGSDGLDEVTTTNKTFVAEYSQEKSHFYEIDPEMLDIPLSRLKDLQGGDVATNSGIILGVFNGQPSPARDIVVLNAACALYAAEKVSTVKDGIKVALSVVEGGKAKAKLEELKRFTNR